MGVLWDLSGACGGLWQILKNNNHDLYPCWPQLNKMRVAFRPVFFVSAASEISNSAVLFFFSSTDYEQKNTAYSVVGL